MDEPRSAVVMLSSSIPIPFPKGSKAPGIPVRDQGVGGSNPLSPTNQNPVKISDFYRLRTSALTRLCLHQLLVQGIEFCYFDFFVKGGFGPCDPDFFLKPRNALIQSPYLAFRHCGAIFGIVSHFPLQTFVFPVNEKAGAEERRSESYGRP